MPTFLRHAAWPPLLIFLLSQRIQGQNLVPNPSFEDVNFCAEFNQPCSPSAWFYLSRRLTTGYFPRFPSATGKRHLQIVAASRETVNRQYWETMLLCPLQAGEHYSVSLKIASPGNEGELSPTRPDLHDIGLWFTTRFVFVEGDSILQPRNFLSFTNSTTVKDLKNGWFEIKKEFVPTSNSDILILGNFVRVPNEDIIERRNWPSPTIDILVDDISVVRMKGAICVKYDKIKDSLYSVTRRHSENLPGLPHPDPSDTPERSDDTPGLSPHPSPHPDIDTLIIRNIQFDFDKYMMKNPDTLLRYRKILTKPGIKKIQVVGFTDDDGTAEYNLDLSQKRAREIAHLLTSKFNIPAAIIQAEGRGISRDYTPKDLNRRVEIYIFHE